MQGGSFPLPDLTPSSSDPSNPATHWQYAPRPPKPRKRDVHPAWVHLGACAACRTRRVKCVRLDPNDPTCEECYKRSCPCADRNQGGRRYKLRRGRNLAAAEAAFGSSSPAPSEDLALVPAGGGPMPSREALSDDCAEGRIGSTESSRALLATLLDQYLEASTHK